MMRIRRYVDWNLLDASVRIPNPARLESRCREFNAKHPIGTPVEYHSVIGQEASIRTKTESEAYVMSGHTAVIFLESVSGCVSLDAVEIAPKEEEA